MTRARPGWSFLRREWGLVDGKRALVSHYTCALCGEGSTVDGAGQPGPCECWPVAESAVAAPDPVTRSGCNQPDGEIVAGQLAAILRAVPEELRAAVVVDALRLAKAPREASAVARMVEGQIG